MSARFTERLLALQAERRSALCVGLDPDPAHLPAALLERHPLPEAVYAFNAAVIEACWREACAFKVNFAFFEALGVEGWSVLKRTVQAVPGGTLVIGDAKRADIGNSARFYARAVYEIIGCDACTVAPYMGEDSVRPFLDFPGKAAFVLAHTSNPGRRDFQELETPGGEPLYARVAREAMRWAEGAAGEAGLVVGATDAAALGALRARCPGAPFLVPGVGAQGGDAEQVMRLGAGGGPVLVNSSRQILYASAGADFAERAGEAAARTRQALQAAAEAA